MPNHVTHRMTFLNKSCDVLLMEMKLKKDPKFKEGLLDFNFFCPGPSGTVINNVAKHGTKWNAYDQTDLLPNDKGNLELSFDTAWSTAEPVWYAIAEQYPEVEILIEYADEDTGNNLGSVYIREGDLSWNEMSDSPDEDKAELLTRVYGTEYFICDKIDCVNGDGCLASLDVIEDCYEEGEPADEAEDLNNGNKTRCPSCKV